MNIQDRVKQPTPKFWKKVRKIGVFIASLSGGVLMSGVTLGPTAQTVLLITGAVGTAIAGQSTLTVKSEE